MQGDRDEKVNTNSWLKSNSVNILGTIYSVEISDEHFDNEDCSDYVGFIELSTKSIYLRGVKSLNEKLNLNFSNDKSAEIYIKETLKHEIVHAFFYESGVADCAGNVNSWANNEPVVEWFAKQGEKIIKAWIEIGCCVLLDDLSDED